MCKIAAGRYLYDPGPEDAAGRYLYDLGPEDAAAIYSRLSIKEKLWKGESGCDKRVYRVAWYTSGVVPASKNANSGDSCIPILAVKLDEPSLASVLVSECRAGTSDTVPERADCSPPLFS